jgi:hypothetical protein
VDGVLASGLNVLRDEVPRLFDFAESNMKRGDAAARALDRFEDQRSPWPDDVDS